MRAMLALVVGVSCASPKPTPPPVVQAAPVPPPPAPEPPKEAPKGPVIPDTPAGKTLAAWLDVFNAADEARTQAFVAQYKYPAPAGAMLTFHKQTGGFELVEISNSERLAIRFVVKEKSSPTTAVGWLTVKDGDPAEMASFTLLAIPPGMTAADMSLTVDAATRARVLDAIAAKLTEFYVYPDGAKKMIQAMREHATKGDYDALTDAAELADRLSEDLRAVTHDGHLHIMFMPKPLPEGDPKPSDDDKARMREQLDKINCGFEKAERLDGNIGYVKFDMFGDAEICGPKATEALGSLGDVGALIFDLRDNGGGQPEMVSFVVSYLFAKRTHVNDLYDRKENKTTQYWTKPDVPGTKFVKQPVYVLTSHRTFSGAEEFTYDLKNLKRATIVGETTGGGAHPTAMKRLDEHFGIAVPFARAINPVTKKDWEGTGVVPDVKVPADDALETAKKLAAERIAKRRQ